MTDNSKDNAYVAALGWATEFFRKYKTDLGKGLPKESMERAVDLMVKIHDAGQWEYPLLAGDTSKAGTTKILGFSVTDSETFDFARRFSAKLLERDGTLPGLLAEFAAASLREPTRPGQRKGMDLFNRDLHIGMAVDHIVNTWGFRRTRNRFSKKKIDCAVSIAVEALGKVSIGLSEADITKASDRYRKLYAQYGSLIPEKMKMALGQDGPEAAADEEGAFDAIAKGIASLDRRK